MSKIVGQILANLIPNEYLWKIKLLNSWESVIGNLKGKVRIEKITETSLMLGVTHSTWAQELFLLSPMIKKKINRLLKEDKIKSIKFKTVKLDKKTQNQPEKPKYPRQQQRQTEYCLTISEHNKLKLINNSELADALEKFYIRCKNITKDTE